MTVLRMKQIDDGIITQFDTVFGSWSNALVTNEGYNATVMSVLKGLCDSLLGDYKTFECHIVGKWKYDTELESYTNLTDFNAVVHLKLQKYKPFLKVFDSEFVKLNRELLRSHSGSNSGNSKSASENSPITAASITTAPSGASDWGLDSPSMKSGSQFNQSHSSSETVTDPTIALRIMNFQVDTLNLTTIANMIVKSFVDEYNTIY